MQLKAVVLQKKNLTPTIWVFVFLILSYSINLTISQTTKTIAVYENATIGTIVGNIPSNNTFGYIVTEISNEDIFIDYFDVDRIKSDGVFVTAGKLDHETISVFDVILFDISSKTYYKIEIDVLDINDNYPTFQSSSVSLTISEASRVGSKFDIGSATDEDSFPFNVEGYRIVNGNSAKQFRVDARHFEDFVFADLIVNQTLNREKNAFFNITIEAFDGGRPPKIGTIQVLITVSDVNDNTPNFDMTRYSVNIGEDSPIGTDVIRMNATDLDAGSNGDIFYRIDREHSDPEMFFIIDSITGVISLNKRLDHEHNTQHKIVVEAVDLGTQPQIGSTVVIVNVDNVNDNPPRLHVLFLDADEAKISEATQPGVYIARVSVSDPDLEDHSSVVVSLKGGDEAFGLQKAGDDTYLIVVLEELNREQKPTFDITLMANDSQKPPKLFSTSFTITITDVNDNTPLFGEDIYQVALEELAPGSYVTQLQATDADAGINSQISYTLLSTNQSDWFTINQDSGLITTRQTLDPSINPFPRLVVVATDKGNPPLSSHATLIITLLDGIAASPVFEQGTYQTSLSEDFSIGRCFLTVEAGHMDSAASLLYSVVNDLQPGASLPFNVTSLTGDVCLASSLDRETRTSYKFEVQATDKNGGSSRAFVDIAVDDVNEYPPVFHPVTYFVNLGKSVPVGFPVTQLIASDNDNFEFSHITFVWLDGDDENRFELNSTSGKVYVEKSLENLVVGSIINLTVAAVDERNFSSVENARITISIVSGSYLLGGEPLFLFSNYHFTVNEDVPLLTLVGDVKAKSPGGSEVAYQLELDPPYTNWFTIDDSSGKISVSAPLDREIFANISFKVIASSGFPPLYSLTSVTIEITDANDNSPHFYGNVEGVISQLTIPYTLDVGSLITVISASDNDEGVNGTVSYSASSAYFELESSTGFLRLISPLPRRSNDYKLNLEARDLGDPPLVSTAELTIRARPPDSNCPTLVKKMIMLSLPENFPLSTSFAAVNISLSNPSAKIHFTVFGSASTAFGIFPNGSLYLNQYMDYEVKSRYEFTILVEGSPSSAEFSRFCSASADVIIVIDDVNDNRPEFSRSLYNFNISENIAKDSVVGEVHASDVDSSPNAQLIYRIDVANSFFEIHPDTGVITTLTPIDRESNARFTFLIDVTDGYHSAQATVHVQIDDVNDNAPEFDVKAPLYAVVPPSSFPGAWVADVRAYDNDESGNGLVTYAITGSSFFDIDTNSGTLTTANTFTNIIPGLHSMTVTATDQGTFPRSNSLALKVNVQASGNPSQYNASQFVFTPLEDADVGHILGSFEPTPPHPRQRCSIILFPFYYVVGGNGMKYFEVNYTNGNLELKRELHYGTSQYNIEVERRSSPGEALLLKGQVNVRQVNNNAPTFTSGILYIAVDESVETEQKVWRFTATDKDSGLDGQVLYRLISQSPSPDFSIDNVTGDLVVTRALNREAASEYLLLIEASDRSVTSPLTSRITCIVTVRDVNDNAPVFVGHRELLVSEAEPVGFLVSRILAVDRDAGANGHMTYCIISIRDEIGRNYDVFRVDSATGELTLTGSLDHELYTRLYVNVSATDGSASNPLTSYQELIIYVINENDVFPQFERLIYEAEVLEGQNEGAVVTKVKASDDDKGVRGQVTYSILHSFDSVNFTIDPLTGIISTMASLNREEVNLYSLKVLAKDNSTSAGYGWTVVNVTVVDINDNNPQFTPVDRNTDPPTLIRLDVSEKFSETELVYVISAHDSDAEKNAQLSYSIQEGNEDGAFFLNSTTGGLWTTNRLDREQTSFYLLKIVASDHGRPVRSDVGVVEVNVLDWNDNDPKFSMDHYHASVNESLSKGQFVLTVRATDPDLGANGQIRYYLLPSNRNIDEPSLFTIDPRTGLITTRAVLDREQLGIHELTAMAVDCSPYNPRNATAFITVLVVDVNDNYPKFENSLMRVNLSAELRPGSFVYHVIAFDDDVEDNALLTYSFLNASEYFSINSTSGMVHTRSRIRSLVSPHYLMVEATDHGFPPKSTRAIVVILTGASPAPARIQLTSTSSKVEIWENVQWGFFIAQVEAKQIGRTEEPIDIAFNILYQSKSDRSFFISQGGAVTVASPSLLDYETDTNVSLLIMAIPSFSNEVTFPISYGFTTIDVVLRDDNDNYPRFDQVHYYASIKEEQSPLLVTQVFAGDLDSGKNGEVRFYIASGDPDGVFHINSTSGVVSISRSLDREIQNKYELVIHASDQGESRKTGTSTVSVDVIDVNDHIPTLVVPPIPVVVSEDTVVGTLLASVTANDVDTEVSPIFSFASNGNPGSYFTINRFNGQIFLTSALDYEAENYLTLAIETSDGSHIVSNLINVTVRDVNDNSPVFTQLLYQAIISELTPPNTPVISVKATDDDANDNGKVSYKILNIMPQFSYFKINEMTGLISTNHSIAYFPPFSLFNLEVEAHDHGSPSRRQSASVLIEIRDVNNNPPLFAQQIYQVQIFESSSLGYYVINLTATDSDVASGNRRIYYEITAGNVGGAFMISANHEADGSDTGEVRIARALDRETRDYYELIVTAYNRGVPRLSSNATVEIVVHETVGKKIRFDSTLYQADVIENNGLTPHLPPVPVLSIHLEDDAQLLLSSPNFEIISGNDEDAFELMDCRPPSLTCTMLAAKLVDYEKKEHYHLILRGFTPGNPSSISTTEVVVNVINVNEFRPSVERFRKIILDEDLKVNQTLFHIHANDGDAGYYGNLTYTLLDSESNSIDPGCLPPGDIIHIDYDTGFVSATRRFDFEQCGMLAFDVGVCDPSDCSSSHIEISILPVDEYPPQFVGIDEAVGFHFFLPYEAAPGYVIGVVNASDQDHGVDGKIRYSLRCGSRDPLDLFIINEITGVITLAGTIKNGSSHTLLLIASSTDQVATTNVTITITDIPLLSVQGTILAIIFGILAVFACIIILILIVRYCRNKHLYKNSDNSTPANLDATAPNGKGDTLKRNKFYDITSRSVPILKSDVKENGTMLKNHSAGDCQLREMNPNAKPFPSLIPHMKQATTDFIVKDHGDKLGNGASRLKEESNEDEEVSRITSTPSSTRRLSPSSSHFTNQLRVADSGIQQDLDKSSDNSSSAGKHSMLPTTDFKIEETPDFASAQPMTKAEMKSGKKEEIVAISGSKQPQPGLVDYMNSVGYLGSPLYDQQGPISDKWTPDFQPLSSVITEIAKLQSESQKKNHVDDSSSAFASPIAPPPLLTSVPPKRDELAAPIPISQGSSRNVTLFSHSFHPSLKRQEKQSASLDPHQLQHRAVPPPYSYVMHSRPESNPSFQSHSSRSSLRSLCGYAPFIQHNPALPPLAAAPISPHSTSPAMSPSLSPSLTPLTTYSPTPIHPVPRIDHNRLDERTSDLLGIIHSQENRIERDPESNERMVRI